MEIVRLEIRNQQQSDDGTTGNDEGEVLGYKPEPKNLDVAHPVDHLAYDWTEYGGGSGFDSTVHGGEKQRVWPQVYHIQSYREFPRSAIS